MQWSWGLGMFIGGAIVMTAAIIWRRLDADERPIRFGATWGFAETMCPLQRTLFFAGLVVLLFGLTA